MKLLSGLVLCAVGAAGCSCDRMTPQGVGDDMTASDDFAAPGPDLAVGSDLRVPVGADLASADLAVADLAIADLAEPVSDLVPLPDLTQCGGWNQPCCGTPGIVTTPTAPFQTYSGECSNPDPAGGLVCWSPSAGYPGSGNWRCVVADNFNAPPPSEGGLPCAVQANGTFYCPLTTNGMQTYTHVVQAVGGPTCLCTPL